MNQQPSSQQVFALIAKVVAVGTLAVCTLVAVIVLRAFVPLVTLVALPRSSSARDAVAALVCPAATHHARVDQRCTPNRYGRGAHCETNIECSDAAGSATVIPSDEVNSTVAALVTWPTVILGILATVIASRFASRIARPRSGARGGPVAGSQGGWR